LIGRRILVTGAGGIGGVNFIRALRLAESQTRSKVFIVGTEFNPFYMEFPDVDFRVGTPRHSDKEFLPTLIGLVRRFQLEFVHPHPSVEAKAVSENRRRFESLGARVYLPPPEEIMPDKLRMFRALCSSKVPVPKTVHVRSEGDIDSAFREMGSPLWMRAMSGAGGRLGLRVASAKEAELWFKLNTLQGRADRGEFILQEYLPGRDIAFDSLWFGGRLVTSFVRERLEYPFKHISLSGITGTPSVSRIIHDEASNGVGISAVQAFNPKPHGFYSVDIKEDAGGHPKVTEVDGKWHTTAPLWGYAFGKAYNKSMYNMVQAYLELGYDGELTSEPPRVNLFPDEHYLIRQMDSGILLKSKENLWRLG
jgi:hypothetical protein